MKPPHLTAAVVEAARAERDIRRKFYGAHQDGCECHVCTALSALDAAPEVEPSARICSLGGECRMTKHPLLLDGLLPIGLEFDHAQDCTGTLTPLYAGEKEGGGDAKA